MSNRMHNSPCGGGVWGVWSSGSGNSTKERLSGTAAVDLLIMSLFRRRTVATAKVAPSELNKPGWTRLCVVLE